MAKLSAGLLLHRRDGTSGAIEVLLVHPGGPFWAKKDEHAWSIPKGEYEPDEDALAAAHREFAEELGVEAPAGPAVSLGELRQSGGKRVSAWAIEGDLDVSTAVSNTFEMEWPPRSGRLQSFPEVDRAEWFTLDDARTKLHQGQVPFVDALLAQLA
jgi:predicted NUDIX family NTP pyrophosphohydrolase